MTILAFELQGSELDALDLGEIWGHTQEGERGGAVSCRLGGAEGGGWQLVGKKKQFFFFEKKNLPHIPMVF